MEKSIIKDVTDYVDYVHEQFPTLTKKHVEKLLLYGFRVFYKFIIQDRKIWSGPRPGTRTQINTKYRFDKNGLYNDMRNATRIKWNREKEFYSGYYFFSLTDEEAEALDWEKLKKGWTVDFKNILIYKNPVEMHWSKRPKARNYFAIEYPADVGFCIRLNKIRSKNYKYLGVCKTEEMLQTSLKKAGIRI